MYIVNVYSLTYVTVRMCCRRAADNDDDNEHVRFWICNRTNTESTGSCVNYVAVTRNILLLLGLESCDELNTPTYKWTDLCRDAVLTCRMLNSAIDHDDTVYLKQFDFEAALLDAAVIHKHCNLFKWIKTNLPTSNNYNSEVISKNKHINRVENDKVCRALNETSVILNCVYNVPVNLCTGDMSKDQIILTLCQVINRLDLRI